MRWNSDRDSAWALLRETDADIALLQEARQPPASAAWADVNPGPWGIAGRRVTWRSAVARLSDRVDVEWIEAKPIALAGSHDFSVSRPGTIAAAVITPENGQPVTVVSMYAAWEYYAQQSGRPSASLAVSSLHRMISDLTRLVGPQTRLIAAGDLNIYRRKSDRPTPWRWPDGFDMHYGTVFDRMAAIGVPFVGPCVPRERQSADVQRHRGDDILTFYTPKQAKPENATQQLDFVFATENIGRQLKVHALNQVDDWGPSDHCRILIELPDPGDPATDPQLREWSCNQCDATAQTLMASFSDRYPTANAIDQLPRIIGRHRGFHTRQSKRKNAENT